MINLKVCICFALLSSLSACAALPPAPHERGISVEQIVEAVQCEIGSAAASSKSLQKLLSGYRAKAELELKLIDTSQAGANALLVLPSAPEVITASLGIGASASSSRKTTVSFGMDVQKLIQKTCGQSPTGMPSSPSSLGLRDWVISAFSAADINDRVSFAEATYTLEFILAANANGGVSVVANRIPNASLGASVNRQDTHTITVALSPKQGPPDPLEVTITNWPAGGVRQSAGSEKRIGPPPGALQSGNSNTLRRLDTLIEREKLKRITIER